MITITCQCCGFSKEFKDEEVAFKEGWDAPPHFSYTTCDLCPSVGLVCGQSHKIAHDLWMKCGRPRKFRVMTCGLDDDMAKVLAASKNN